MAGEIEHIKGKGFDANPQNINKNGRPKKGISAVNDELKARGYTPAKKVDIEDQYLTMIHLDEDELKEILGDKTRPMLSRILAKSLLSGKGFEIAEKMLDRGIGRPKVTVDSNMTVSLDGKAEDTPTEQLNKFISAALKGE